MISRDSLGTLTDRLVLPDDTRWKNRGEYRAAHTPSRPDFHSGNYLVLDDPPPPGKLAEWFQKCADEFAYEDVKRLMMMWETGVDDEWSGASEVPAGTRYECHLVMTANTPPPAQPDVPGIEIRAISGDDEWNDAAELNIAVNAGEFGPGYADFGRWRFEEYRQAFEERGAGMWWAAFDGARQVCGFGLYISDKLMRFQAVNTLESHRRRGIAAATITAALTRALQAYPAATAVIVADRDSPGEKLYRKLGFEAVGRQHWVQQRPGKAEPEAE